MVKYLQSDVNEPQRIKAIASAISSSTAVISQWNAMFEELTWALRASALRKVISDDL